MNFTCERCGRECSAGQMVSINGEMICSSCNYSPHDSYNTPVKKQYNINNISIILIDHGFKEYISKKEINIWRIFDLLITNNTKNTLEWITLGVIIQNFKQNVSYSSYIRDGNTQYSKHKYKTICTYRSDLNIDTAIQPSMSARRENCRLMYGKPEQFYGLELYNIWGKFTNGQTFNYLVHKEKMDFDQNRCNSKDIKEGNCFVTTAAFGDQGHPMVVEFRNFRDNRLVHYNFGRRFIQWYNTNGPVLANFIENCPAMRCVARLLLQPLAICIRAFHLSDKKHD